MSKRTNSHTISHAESIFSGSAYIGGADGRGIPRASLVQVDLGTPKIADVNGIGSQDSGAASFPFDMTIDGALASGGVATFDVPRGVQVVSTSGACSSVFTFQGTDKYGVPIEEDVTANAQTIVFGKKAFKTITKVTVDKDTETTINFGDSDVLGLPFRLENVADILVIDENDQNKFQVTGQTAANPAAATAVSLVAAASTALTITNAVNAVSTPGGSGLDATGATEIDALFGEVKVDLDATKVEVDRLVVENDDAKVQVDKLVVDVEAIRAEVIKLVADAAAIDSGTLVKADATVTQTATTGDVRGTYNPTMTLDGSKTLKLTFKPKGRDTAGAYGSVQFRS